MFLEVGIMYGTTKDRILELISTNEIYRNIASWVPGFEGAQILYIPERPYDAPILNNFQISIDDSSEEKITLTYHWSDSIFIQLELFVNGTVKLYNRQNGNNYISLFNNGHDIRWDKISSGDKVKNNWGIIGNTKNLVAYIKAAVGSLGRPVIVGDTPIDEVTTHKI